jgi:hypothetical protein
MVVTIIVGIVATSFVDRPTSQTTRLTNMAKFQTFLDVAREHFLLATKVINDFQNLYKTKEGTKQGKCRANDELMHKEV